MLENSLALPDIRIPARYSCDVCGEDSDSDMVTFDTPAIYRGAIVRSVCHPCWCSHMCKACRETLADGPTTDLCINCEIAWYVDNIDEFIAAEPIMRQSVRGMEIIRKVRLAHYQKLEKELA